MTLSLGIQHSLCTVLVFLFLSMFVLLLFLAHTYILTMHVVLSFSGSVSF